MITFKRNLRLDAGRKQLAAKLAKLKAGAAGDGKGEGDSGEFGISWGFDEDAVAEEEDEDEEGVEGGDEEAVRRLVSFVLVLGVPLVPFSPCLSWLDYLRVWVLRLSVTSLLAQLSAFVDRYLFSVVPSEAIHIFVTSKMILPANFLFQRTRWVLLMASTAPLVVMCTTRGLGFDFCHHDGVGFVVAVGT